MNTSRQTVRREPSLPEPPPGLADLPCYEMDELTEWQISTPMPARRRARLVDRDVTEALGAHDPRPPAGPPQDAGQSRAPAAPTQPIETCAATAEAPGPDEAFDREASNGARFTPAHERPPRNTRALRPGEVLCDRYVIEEKVAHYGMGHVYRALDRHRQAAGAREPWVALKFARRTVGGDGETTTLLRQEFLKLSALRHPNIVDVFDLARDGELEFIVMEWLAGETLADLLARITTRRIALDRAADIIRSTARALAHAHDLGIVHGDVKPSNIFLAAPRGVKLLDFGSSGSSSGENGERHWATRAYASPEVLDGRPPQPHDDVFALGVTAYDLFSGERPFGELDALVARERRVAPGPLPADALDKWPAIRHALAYDAIDRPGNARLFLNEFEQPAGDPAGDEAGRDSRTAFYGAVAAALLASLVWWSASGVDGQLTEENARTLAAADRALAEGRLAGPPAESALALYSAVLDGDPHNRLALAGLDDVAGQLVTRAREAVFAGDPAAARRTLELARAARPQHPGITLVEDLLAAQGRAALLEATEAARSDLSRAEDLLAEAAAALPEGDAGLARAREAVTAERRSHRVGELLREIDERILAERLSVPTGDSALDLLRRARGLSPEDPRLAAAADRIMTALLFQAMFAISNGDLVEAENFLSMARGMNLPHLALVRAEYELARARRAALAAGGARSGR